ncbi:unnamed protein product [Ilex paraguariensis]
MSGITVQFTIAINDQCFVPGNMNLVQNLMERLRPIVGMKSWNYCVFWRLNEEQRFFEWMGCCCAGTENLQNGGEEILFPVSSVLPCRDFMFMHPRTISCDLLVQLPSSMPLDSGFHAQTFMSDQPKWFNVSMNSDSNVSEETVGTKVLIPVPFGLIELFVARQISEDQNVIDYIKAQCSTFLDQQTIINSSNVDSNFSVNVNAISEVQSKPPLFSSGNDQKDHNSFHQPPVSPATAMENNLNLPYDISIDRIHLCTSPMNYLHQYNFTENRSKTDMFMEGTNESFPSDKPLNPFQSSPENKYQDMDSFQKSLMSNMGNVHGVESLGNMEQQGNDKDSMKNETGRSDSVSDCSDPNDDEEDTKYRRRTGKGPQSKNLVAERKRRKKLNDRLYALRALVPNISKLDRASILGDAIEFVKELQKQVEDLQNELEEHSDDEGANNNHSNLTNGQPDILLRNGTNLGPGPEHEKLGNGFHMGVSGNGGTELLKQNPDSENTGDKVQQMEPQVEVAQLGGNEFFVKVFCEHKAGGFARLMEALNSLGLEVTNVNVTSFRKLDSNVFKVEKIDSELVQADHVRDSLLELTRNPSRGRSEMATTSENGNGMDHHHHHLIHLHRRQINSHHHMHHFHTNT